jgi:hypothetical protein
VHWCFGTVTKGVAHRSLSAQGPHAVPSASAWPAAATARVFHGGLLAATGCHGAGAAAAQPREQTDPACLSVMLATSETPSAGLDTARAQSEALTQTTAGVKVTPTRGQRLPNHPAPRARALAQLGRALVAPTPTATGLALRQLARHGPIPSSASNLPQTTVCLTYMTL